MYHRVGHASDYPWNPAPITGQDFEYQMRYLMHRYQIMSLRNLAIALGDPDTALPRNTAVITFDDGCKDMYSNAYPILKKYGIPATVFLTTGHIGTDNPFWWDKVGYAIWKTKLDELDLGVLGTFRLPQDSIRPRLANTIIEAIKLLPEEKRDELVEGLMRSSQVDIPANMGKELVLSWDEIREMNNSGIDFGAHTVTHPILTKIPIEISKKEIVDSKRHIEKEVDQEVTTFCYPNGGPGDFDAKIEEILKNNGFICAVTAAPLGFVSSTSSLYGLPRISAEAGFDKFRLLIFGVQHYLVSKWNKQGDTRV
jgi:peptidoglycan/xylan/chitin deacetylase (PgdA/CDA1 family)